MGRIVVRNHDRDVTSDCIASFEDSVGDEKATRYLEPNGWVFTTLDRGDTKLAEVRCNIGWAAAFRVEGVRFHVPGEGAAPLFRARSCSVEFHGPERRTARQTGARQHLRKSNMT